MFLQTYHIHINGIVQGVGFRPFIYNLAIAHHLKGWVRNSANGVDIEITTDQNTLETFVNQIQNSAPPLAQIDSITTEKINHQSFDAFNIVESKNKASDFIPISPDVAICSQCQQELFDSQDRRFRYPFINCTNCGPRFSIIKDIPYDRPMTTMAEFEMCSDCRKEYEDPTDRRFHAQPVACPVCGPQIWVEDNADQNLAEKEEAIRKARQMLADGKILAIKGLGGFHLACDAANPAAVRMLRQRKNRPSKPFALMAYDLASIANFVHMTSNAEDLLTSPQAPIVLMPKKSNISLADSVAPGQANLGFMLPYTPLHLLLLEPEPGYPSALVMTSGNLSEEPVLHEDQVAREKLAPIVDGFLMHDRPIHRRIDDSVYAIVMDEPYPVRRARGYAPNPIRLAEALPEILAVGPQMKNTFCLTRDKYAFISHHIGEMDNWETFSDFKNAVRDYEELFRIHPQAVGYDLHPDYVSTTYALERASAEGLPRYAIQHHHAHLAAVMIENRLSPAQNVAGLIFDGTGYGTDGTIWGGEVLIGNCDQVTRFAHLKAVPLPGGDAAIRKPSRMALSTLWAYGLPWEDDLAPVQALTETELLVLKNQLEKGINAPLTSSMGRLFDSVAALIGVRQSISYEAQAAIELEALAEKNELGYYAWQMDGDVINIKPMLTAILADIKQHVTVPIISARFHNTLAQMSLDIAKSVNQQHQIDQIVLSGGVWQNQLLLEKTYQILDENGFHPLIHRQLPPNDGCVAFGQAMITAYRYKKDKE